MTISQFLLRLAADPTFRETYRDNPELAFDEFGLTAHQRDLLRAANLQQLKITIEAEARVDDETFSMLFFTIWFLHDREQD